MTTIPGRGLTLQSLDDIVPGRLMTAESRRIVRMGCAEAARDRDELLMFLDMLGLHDETASAVNEWESVTCSAISPHRISDRKTAL